MSHIPGLNSANDQCGKSRQKPRNEVPCGGGGGAGRQEAGMKWEEKELRNPYLKVNRSHPSRNVQKIV